MRKYIQEYYKELTGKKMPEIDRIEANYEYFVIYFKDKSIGSYMIDYKAFDVFLKCKELDLIQQPIKSVDEVINNYEDTQKYIEGDGQKLPYICVANKSTNNEDTPF